MPDKDAEGRQKLIERLDREEKHLDTYGYAFPAIFDVLRFLLKQPETNK